MLDILKNYLKSEEYYIVIYSNYVYIYNYLEIIKFNDNNISLRVKGIIVNIYGNNMLITKMESKELLIKGIINNVEKIYE